MSLTAKDLKNAILQMAMEGKLVEQRPEEGTGEELFNQIQKETKSPASNSKSNKSPNSFNIQSDEIPFDIPTSWKWVKSSWILSNIQYGYNGSGIDKGTYRFLRITDIQNGKVNWSSIPFTNIASEEAENYQVKKNDIFIARTGGTIGKSFLLREEKENTIFAGYLIRFQCKDTRIAPYLSWFLNSPFYWRQVEDKKAGTGQPNINGKSLANLLIPLPPLAEQKRIVAKIEELMPLVDRYERAFNELNELNEAFPIDMEKSILQLAMKGKLVEQKPGEGTGQELFDSVQIRKKVVSLEKQKPVISSDLGEYSFNIPESWKWCRIGDLFEHNTGKALNSSNKTGKLYEYITTSNVFWNRFELKKLRTMLYKDDELERCSVRKGDLLVLEGGDIGRAAIWDFDYPMRIQNHIHKLRPYGEISVEFFYYVFRYYKFAGLIDGKGIGIQGLSTKALHNLVVPLPPLAEQKRIVAKIEELMPLIGKLASKS